MSMPFKKKLKTRLFVAVGYLIIGIIMIVVFNLLETDNNFLSSFGFALVTIGIVRVRNYLLITKSEETIRKQQIAETDERNIFIANRAKSISFTIYVLLACVSVIVLEILSKTELAMILSGTVCIMLLIYWVSYWIIRKKL